jgi:hypothetical protein
MSLCSPSFRSSLKKRKQFTSGASGNLTVVTEPNPTQGGPDLNTYYTHDAGPLDLCQPGRGISVQ